jgi:hypothetical protein
MLLSSLLPLLLLYCTRYVQHCWVYQNSYAAILTFITERSQELAMAMAISTLPATTHKLHLVFCALEMASPIYRDSCRLCAHVFKNLRQRCGVNTFAAVKDR